MALPDFQASKSAFPITIIIFSISIKTSVLIFQLNNSFQIKSNPQVSSYFLLYQNCHNLGEHKIMLAFLH